MPRYGCINERRNQLHEVIRLSGMNIIIGEVDRPLVIRVASVAAARLQVYFIDNEDYFKRKLPYADADGVFYPDNGERAIFFARGVLETVKKLRWAPDVIHCHGWISQVLPLYLKKVYKDDPIFSGSKIVLSLYGDTPKEVLSKDFSHTILFGGIKDEDTGLPAAADGTELARLAMRYSDGVIQGSADVAPALLEYAKELGLKVLPFNEKAVTNGTYIDEYDTFYESL